MLLRRNRTKLLRLEALFCSGMNLATKTSSLLPGLQDCSKGRMETFTLPPSSTEVEGRIISVNRHLHHLYPFMGVETVQPQADVFWLEDNKAAGITAQGRSNSDVSDNIFWLNWDCNSFAISILWIVSYHPPFGKWREESAHSFLVTSCICTNYDLHFNFLFYLKSGTKFTFIICFLQDSSSL